jgi:crotonobetainyl-CoA:carnitine CoA-transferase CaiB-like acyl-CoA transferase
LQYPRARSGGLTKPFRGVRVVEVAAWTFVPAAGGILADLGADVIKVEPPSGDPQRGLKNRLQRPEAANPFVEIPNRGKRSITLDLATSPGRDVLLGLARTADVFLTSYLGPVRRRLGIDVDDVRAVNPSIVYVRGSGWGPAGPMADKGGFDLAAAWATSAMAHRMTRPPEEPMYQPSAFYDLLGANTIAGAIGTALFQRERTGEAVDVHVSLLNVGMWSLCPDLMAAPSAGSQELRDRSRVSNPIVNSYRTADHRWLYLVCLQGDRHWTELCDLIGRADLAEDVRFRDAGSRAANAEDCIHELDATFESRTLADWQDALNRFTGVWAPVLEPIELYDHPQVVANGYLANGATNEGTPYRLPAPPMQFGEPVQPAGPAPDLGQHTEEVLLELGRSWEDIVELRNTGVLG